MRRCQSENGRGNRKRDVGQAAATDAAIKRSGRLRLLAGDARRRAGFARWGLLPSGRRLTWQSCGGGQSRNQAGKAANRAERALNLPRKEKDHAFSLNRSMQETGIAY